MEAYYVSYEIVNEWTHDYKRTEIEEMRAEGIDNLRRRLAKEVRKMTKGDQKCTATVMLRPGHDPLGNVIGCADGTAIWEPLGANWFSMDVFYPINPRTGKLGQKKRWYRA